MPDYRIYLLDKYGRIERRNDAKCYDHQHAFAVARTKLGGHPSAEVWIGTKRLGAILPSSAPADDSVVTAG